MRFQRKIRLCSTSLKQNLSKYIVIKEKKNFPLHVPFVQQHGIRPSAEAVEQALTLKRSMQKSQRTQHSTVHVLRLGLLVESFRKRSQQKGQEAGLVEWAASES